MTKVCVLSLTRKVFLDGNDSLLKRVELETKGFEACVRWEILWGYLGFCGVVSGFGEFLWIFRGILRGGGCRF